MLFDDASGEFLLGRVSFRLEVGSSSLLSVDVGKTDIFKLSFTVIDDENADDGIQPHQAFLRFYSPSGEEGIQPVKISSSGKGKFELVCIHPRA